MKLGHGMRIGVATAAIVLAAAAVSAQDLGRDRSEVGKMFHKLGRGVTNVLTSWVEIPRNIAIEWERTDPVTGMIVGSAKGLGWGFARFATGVYETFTFPLPVPDGYAPMIQPEFIITNLWGEPLPGFSDMTANDPRYSGGAQVPPQAFGF